MIGTIQDAPQTVVENVLKFDVFKTAEGAEKYRKEHGGMVIKEQGKNLWFVMPAFDGVKQVNLPMTEN